MIHSILHNHKSLLTISTLISACALSACSSEGGSSSQTQTSANQPIQTSQQAQAAAAPSNQSAQVQLASVTPDQSAAASGQICNFQIAGGPPSKPSRGKDFGVAATKNVGKQLQRGLIQQVGARFGGGLGASIAGGVAQATIRSEQDIKGVWKIVDGNTGCGCQLSIDSLYKLKGKGADTGKSQTLGCQSPQMKQVSAWALGYKFAGYDAKFELKNGSSIVATMNRDGIHYFSGTFANGTPVTMWRDKQNYNQLTSFKKSAKAGG